MQQLLAHRRLRDVAPRCRTLEMQLFSEGDEGQQAAAIHDQ
jgi:hypothetical protein